MKVSVGFLCVVLFLGTAVCFPSSEVPTKNETTVLGTIETSDNSNSKISPILIEPTDELNSTSLPIPFVAVENNNSTKIPTELVVEHQHIPHKCPNRSHISPMDVIKDIKLQEPSLNDTVHEPEVRSTKDHVELSDLETPVSRSVEMENVRAVPELESLAKVVLPSPHNTTNVTSAEPQSKTGRSAEPETKSEVGALAHSAQLAEIEEKLKKAQLNEKSIRQVLETVLGEKKTDEIMPESSTRTKRSVEQSNKSKTIGIKNEYPTKVKKSQLKFKRSASYSDAPVRSASYSSGTRSSDMKYAVRTKPVRTTRSGYGGTRSATRSSYGPTRSVPVPEDIRISLNTEVLSPVRSVASSYSTTRQIEEVKSGYQTIREIPEIRTSYETVREIPAVRSNYETVREVPVVRSNYETVREVPVVRSNYETVREVPVVRANYETVREAPVVRTNYEIVREAPVVRTNYETVREVPVVRSNYETVREVPQVKTIVREVPVVRTVVKDSPIVKTTYTETRTTPEIRTTYVPTRSSYGTRTRTMPETKFNYNAPDTRSTYTQTRQLPEIKSSYETVRKAPEIKSTYETVRSLPETKSVYTTVREAPRVRTVSYATAVRAAPEIRTTSYDDTRDFEYITDLTDLPESLDFPAVPVLGDDDGDRYKRSPAPKTNGKDKTPRHHFSHRSHVASRAASNIGMPQSF